MRGKRYMFEMHPMFVLADESTVLLASHRLTKTRCIIVDVFVVGERLLLFVVGIVIGV